MRNEIVSVDFKWIDPWTGEFCCGWVMPWDKRRAAKSMYSRQIRNMKLWAKEFCTGPRTPKLVLKINRANKEKP